MSQKGVYPYNYMDSFNKFDEKLPTKEDVLVLWIMSISQMKIINMLKMYGIHLNLKQWDNTMIYILNLTSFY